MKVASPAAPIGLVVPREASGARLDRFLAAALAGLPEPPSRAALQRWIESGRVLVDGAPRKTSDKVVDGSRIRVHPEPPPLSDARPEEGIAFDVLYKDDDIVVVNKPAGLVVHPARGHASGTLVNGLLAMGAFDVPAEEVADATDPAGHLRPGIVHRLDKGTSGVMVVARTPRARERLKEQFAAHTIEREYEALCVGDVKAATHDTLHGRHPTDRLRFTTRVREGRRAVTHVRVLERLANGEATHVACRLETGRTHQLRVHLAESGTAILGDPIYGKPPSLPQLRLIGDALGHQALHARLLGFTHPTHGGMERFEAAAPDDVQAALARCRELRPSLR
jgi:23S rRNA pseudouridine1911/1915/1917 synthase